MADTPSSEADATRGAAPACPLCIGDGGELLWRNGQLRVVLAGDVDYPAFTRVIWHAHCAEMTDLSPAEREALMRVVWEAEAVLREVFEPDKINLASFGNMVPHLHWHLIPRWRDDRHFPEPVWGAPTPGREAAVAARRGAMQARLSVHRSELRRRLDALASGAQAG